jgi:hypothetical protein
VNTATYLQALQNESNCSLVKNYQSLKNNSAQCSQLAILKLELLATVSIPQMALSCNWHVLISKRRTTHTYFTLPSNLLSCTAWSLEENTKMYQNKGYFKIIVIQDMMQCSMVYRYQSLWLLAAASNYKRIENRKLQLQFFELLMMSGVSLETCWAIKKHWNNKFYYTVATCWFFLWDLYYDAWIHKHQVYPHTCAISVTEVWVLQNNSLRSRYKIG